jgi:predicted TIM-barrel fold metal-dependent hydrolase
LRFAIERDYDAEAQIMAMQMEGIDIAVLFPTGGLSLISRNGMDPQLSLALSQAYNNWIHEFCQYSPNQLKFAAMLPLHDVNLACQELVRCVRELGAVASFIRPNLLNGHYWHSNYWDPLYSLHEELDVAWCFHLIVRHIFLTGHGGHEVLFCLRDRLSANVFGTNHRVHSSDDRPRAGNIAGGVVAPRLWKTELA